MSLKKHIMIVLIVFSILPLACLAIIFSHIFTDSQNKLINEYIVNMSTREVSSIGDFFEKRRIDALAIAANEEVEAYVLNFKNKQVAPGQATRLSEKLREKKYLGTIKIVDLNGQIILSDKLDLVGKRLDDFQDLKSDVQIGVFVSDVAQSQAELNSFTYTYPVYQARQLAYYIVQVLDTDMLEAYISRGKFFNTGRIDLIDSQGSVVAMRSNSQNNVQEAMHTNSFTDIWNEVALNEEQNGFINYDVGKIAHLAYYKKIPQSRWLVLTSLDKAEVNAPINKVRQFLFWSILILFALITGSYYFYWQRLNIIRDDFLKAINKVQAGDYSAHIDYRRYNEIGLVARAFNRLIKEIASVTIQARKNEAKYRFALESVNGRIFEADVTADLLISGHEYWQRESELMMGTKHSDNIRIIADKYVHPEDRQAYLAVMLPENIIKAYAAGNTDMYVEYRSKIRKPDYEWLACNLIPVLDTATKHLMIIACIKNIHDKKMEELEIIDKAQKDQLTGLYNKVVTRLLIEDYLDNDKFLQNGALVLLDLDNFKRVNDCLGHLVGDRLLVDISRELHDLFGEKHILGRFGGDEFLIFIKDFSDQTLLVENLQSILRICHKKFSYQNEVIEVSGSLGISLYPEHGQDYLSLYEKADRAMYKAKSLAKNQYAIYQERF